MRMWDPECSDSRERERERERDERREYESDVYYEVWRSGRDPDQIDFDRVDDNRRDGLYPEESAAIEIKAQRPKRQESDEV